MQKMKALVGAEEFQKKLDDIERDHGLDSRKGTWLRGCLLVGDVYPKLMPQFGLGPRDHQLLLSCNFIHFQNDVQLIMLWRDVERLCRDAPRLEWAEISL